MKIFALAALATAASVGTASAALHAGGARSAVFVPDALRVRDDAQCHFHHTEAECVQDHCLWCKSAAVPSSCYTEEEADQLPPAVFQCDKGSVGMDLWAITEVGDVESLFHSWKTSHGKTYASAIEDEMRRAVFESNARMVATHNSRNDASFTMELNKFADLTWAEFKKWYLAAPQNCSATHTSTTNAQYGDVPEEKDWRLIGAVTPVKNQGKCGSCWTFSTTGALESHNILKHGKTALLSEQNLLDCAQAFDNHGCNGGLPSHAFEYVHYNGGLDTEEAYPYEAKENKCKFNTYHVGVKVESVVNITSLHEDELKSAVGSVGPVSIAFQVASDFRFYKTGVYDSTVCKSGEQDVNHAVLAVGYGAATGKPHWIVKNSWGTTWGMDGYFQIARGKNMCGLADCAAYPVVQ